MNTNLNFHPVVKQSGGRATGKPSCAPYSIALGFWVSLNMTAGCLILLTALSASAQLQTNFPVTLTNLSGRVYARITLDHTNKLGFIWQAADGSQGQIKYYDLSPATLAELKVSPATVQEAYLAEARSSDFWKRKAAYDAYMGPILAKSNAQAAKAAMAQTAKVEAMVDVLATPLYRRNSVAFQHREQLMNSP
jgi:hypothetical protein